MNVPFGLIQFDSESAEFLRTFDTQFLSNLNQQQIDIIHHFICQISDSQISPTLKSLLNFNWTLITFNNFIHIDMRKIFTSFTLLSDEIKIALENNIQIRFPPNYQPIQDSILAFLNRQNTKYEVDDNMIQGIPNELLQLLSENLTINYPIFNDLELDLPCLVPIQAAKILTRGQIFYYCKSKRINLIEFIRYCVREQFEFEQVGQTIRNNNVDSDVVDDVYTNWCGGIDVGTQIIELSQKNQITIQLKSNISKNYIQTPCRTVECNHLQVFELKDYQRKGLCPICMKQGELYIDKYFQNIIDILSDEYKGFGIVSVKIDPLTFCCLDVIAHKFEESEVICID